MHLEAGWMGIATARGLTDAARERVKAAVTLDVAGKINWDGWTPGNPALVETFLGEGKFDYPNFQAFLDRAGVTIRGVEETRLNDLGSILARSAEAGLSMDATASMIQSEFFANGAWAEMVARTEIRRASTESALGYYGEAGIEQKEWLVAWDEACEICQEAADMGPIPLDADFGEAGDGPPGHPNCLCVILPVVGEPETETLEDVEAEAAPEPEPEPMPEPEPEALPEALIEDLPKVKMTPEEIDAQAQTIVQKINDFAPDPMRGDPAGAVLTEMLGYDALPKVVTEQEFDNLILNGATEVYRGVLASPKMSAADMVQEFQTGTYYNGYGIYGNGTYASNSFYTSVDYAGGINEVMNGNGQVMRVAISPDAKMISYNDFVDNEVPKWDKIIAREAATAPDYKVDYNEIFNDQGYLAMRLGYDVLVKNFGGAENYYVILNRGVLSVQDEVVTKGRSI